MKEEGARNKRKEEMMAMGKGTWGGVLNVRQDRCRNAEVPQLRRLFCCSAVCDRFKRESGEHNTCYDAHVMSPVRPFRFSTVA
jgi:hypothetical protein